MQLARYDITKDEPGKIRAPRIRNPSSDEPIPPYAVY